MPELLLLRHAKSDWDAGFSHDRDRPLSDRGRRSAAAIGKLLTATRRMPDLAITSPAVRARTTVETAAEAGDWGVPIHVDDRLYGGGPEDALAVVRERSAGASRLILVGHEPTWSGLAAGLIGGGDIRMATGAVAAIEVPAWDRIGWHCGTLLWMVAPRLLTDGDLDLAT